MCDIVCDWRDTWYFRRACNAFDERGTMFGMGGIIIDIFAVILVIFGVAELVVAYGIWNMKKWARITGIILAVIGLINIPIGTIISIVILLLIDKNTKDLFPE